MQIIQEIKEDLVKINKENNSNIIHYIGIHQLYALFINKYYLYV